MVSPTIENCTFDEIDKNKKTWLKQKLTAKYLQAYSFWYLNV